MSEPSVTPADLGRIGLLEGLPTADLDALAGVASRRRLSDGEVLFAQGEAAGTLYSVVEGGLVLRATGNGRSVIVQTLGPGEVVGWTAMREGATTLSAARATGRTVVIAIPVEPIIDLAAGGSSESRLLVRRLIGLAAEHLEASRRQLLQVGREGVITAG
jgi:CRP/FNR family transcriptional regulator, cyclic AMP receptor protein